MADLLTLPRALADFLRAAAEDPFVFGQSDCCMTLANWVRFARGGLDPAEAIRGSYSTDAGWRAIVDEAGGLIALVDGIARRAGLERIHPDDAVPGDVAVAKIGGNDFELGAICVGRDRWTFKLQRGVQRFPATRALAAWRV